MRYLEANYRAAERERKILKETLEEMQRNPCPATMRWAALHTKRVNGITEFIEKQIFVENLVEALREAG